MTSTTPAPRGTAPTEGVSAHQLQWLRTEVAQWRSEGLITAEQGDVLLGRYHATRTFSLTRLMLALGACFVGVGVIWLIAANIATVPPWGRFLLVAALWLSLLVGGEAMEARGLHRLWVGAVRLLAAFAVGGVVFQAAQSLQVPAYEPRLVGLWGAAALLQAYTFRALGPLTVGAVATAGWSVWQGVQGGPSFADVTFTLSATGVAALGVAAWDERRRPDFAAVWRVLGVGFVLAGLFAAALPIDDRFEWQGGWWFVALWILVAATALLVVVRRHDRLTVAEILGALVALGVALLLVAWRAGDSVEEVTLTSWLHTAVAVVAYVVVAVGVAVVGTLRDSRALPAVSTVALVVFTTFQSFAVFAPIIDGAWLFLLLGVVFLASGWGFDRVRRRLAASLDDDGPGSSTPDASTPDAPTPDAPMTDGGPR